MYLTVQELLYLNDEKKKRPSDTNDVEEDANAKKGRR